MADVYDRARHERLLNGLGWMPSRFAGTCVVCDTRFSAGTPIHRDQRGPFGQWVGACCADTVED